MRVKVSIPEKGDKVLILDDDCDMETFQGIVLSTYEDNNLTLTGLRFGYPPQTLDFEGNETKTLDDLGISNGERIILNILRGSSVETTCATDKYKSEANRTNLKSSADSSVDRMQLDQNRYIQVHQVPDDNSCLFHAIAYAVYKDISLSPELRRIVSSEITKDSITYSDAILGRPNHEYSEWILKLSSWGGGIEIAVLSKYLQVAIYVLDMDACKFEKFNDEFYDNLIIIAYNGVHYDTIEVVEGNTHRTVFDIKESDTAQLLEKTEKVASKMKAAGRTFNTTRDSILCNICGSTLIGEREVSKHAEKTGHFDFRQK